RRPPLIADRCFRTVLISPIVAPERRRSRVTACLSASVRPAAGSASSAEPPPEIRQTSWSPSPSSPARARMRLAAFSPAASGTGWLASTISIRSQGTAWPRRVTTSPESGPRHASSKARAIAAEALPAPIATVRPGTGGGRRPARARSGAAAASAASNRPRRNSPGAGTVNSLFRLANRCAISYRARRKDQRDIDVPGPHFAAFPYPPLVGAVAGSGGSGAGAAFRRAGDPAGAGAADPRAIRRRLLAARRPAGRGGRQHLDDQGDRAAAEEHRRGAAALAGLLARRFLSRFLRRQGQSQRAARRLARLGLYRRSVWADRHQ